MLIQPKKLSYKINFSIQYRKLYLVNNFEKVNMSEITWPADAGQSRISQELTIYSNIHNSRVRIPHTFYTAVYFYYGKCSDTFFGVNSSLHKSCENKSNPKKHLHDLEFSALCYILRHFYQRLAKLFCIILLSLNWTFACSYAALQFDIWLSGDKVSWFSLCMHKFCFSLGSSINFVDIRGVLCWPINHFTT